MNVDAMLAEIGPEQFNEWIAIYRLEPWGDDWAQAGTVAAAVANSSGNYQETKSPTDFIPGEMERLSGVSDEELREKHARKYGAK